MIIGAIAFSSNGCRTALRLKQALPEDDVRPVCKTTSDNLGIDRIDSVDDWTKASFDQCDAIVFIGALGIAVRYIAPYVKSKTSDPAVVGMDEHGRWAIALLSGHIGGCNDLVQRISLRMGSEPIITTATDINGKFSVDSFAARNDMSISSMALAKDCSARVLDGRFVGFCSDVPIDGKLPEGVTQAESGEFGVLVSTKNRKPFDTTLNLIPRDIVLGVGCKRGTDSNAMKFFTEMTLEEYNISPMRVSAIASIDLKKDEPAMADLARHYKAPVRFFSAEQLNSIDGEFTASKFVSSITGVDCVCERSAVATGGESFILRKTAHDGMTIAICSKAVRPRFI